MSKITFEAVKTAVLAHSDITDRGDLVRKVAEVLGTNYGVVYLKVRKAEAELGVVTSSRKGRRPGKAKAVPAPVETVEVTVAPAVETSVETFTIVRAKDNVVVAQSVSAETGQQMIDRARSAKKAALKFA